jgi:GTPase SAR1 family protein
MGEVLFLGPKGAGKSLLLKRMQNLSEEKRLSPFDPISVPKPTSGTDLSQAKFRGSSYTFKEIGGPMLKDWANHVKTPVGIVYVFDSADLTKIATNVVWLNELLNDHSIDQKPILICLAKCDVPDCIRFSVIDEIIAFDRVLNPSRLTFLETSAVLGVGLSDIFHWISELPKSSSS